MPNKYLEKIALNAQSARAMAKQVGIVADHTSAWKYALRNLRDGRGNALEGKALHEARAKLGDISNNTFQKLKGIHGKYGGTQGYEFTTQVNHKGKLSDSIIKGNVKGEGNPRGIVGGQSDNLHTHPGTTIPGKIHLELKKFPNRHAKPSGMDTLNSVNKIWGKGGVSGIIHDFRSLLTDHKQTRKKAILAYNSGNFSKSMDLQTKLNHIGSDIDRIDGKVKSNNSFAQADVKSLVRKNMYKQDNHMERIVAPDHNVVSSNKSRGDGIRTVYFDHSPKKSR